MAQPGKAPRPARPAKAKSTPEDALAQSLVTMLRKSGAVFPEAPAVALIQSNPIILCRLAKFLVQQCFRNTIIEDYHAGHGRGGKGSAITQSEMKALMIEAVDNTYSLLWVLFRADLGPCVLAGLDTFDPVPCWNEPHLDPKIADGVVAMLRLLSGAAGSIPTPANGRTKRVRRTRGDRGA